MLTIFKDELQYFCADDTPNLLAYHFSIVGTLMVANVVFLSQACYMLHKEGIAFTCLTRKFSKKTNRQHSQDDSVFDSTESYNTKTSSITSKIFPKLVSWNLSDKLKSLSMKKDSVSSLDKSVEITSQSSTETSLDRSSLSSTFEMDKIVVIPEDEDNANDIQSEVKGKRNLNKKDWDINYLQGNRRTTSGPSYVMEYVYSGLFCYVILSSVYNIYIIFKALIA